MQIPSSKGDADRVLAVEARYVSSLVLIVYSKDFVWVGVLVADLGFFDGVFLAFDAFKQLVEGVGKLLYAFVL
ncbi:hypothetical protein KDA_32440 [Dictyobacter alpinus]|uniref:Uncharacterized protein n=1 Tax=Dictyobacter alpinus TaxID=2014873 RepID=A0A402B8Y1_9CHLR|nr:hypothetical protein KDA_32440 [Dictyobacter alpinus]